MHKMGFEDILAWLPELTPLVQRIGVPDDLFLCALGFEDRCVGAPERLATQGYRTRRVAYFTYPVYEEANNRNRERLDKVLLKISGQKPDTIPYYLLRTPDDFGVTFNSWFREIQPQVKSVTFDITSCTSSLILQTLRELLNKDITLRIVYSEADTYYPLEKDWLKHRHEWDKPLPGVDIFWGIDVVTSARGLSGRNPSGSPILLVAFPGFKRERVGGIVAETQPAKVIWLFGIASKKDREWRMEAMQEINRELVGQADETYDVPTYEYKPVLKRLEDIYLKYKYQYAIAVAAVGSKMQSVALSLFTQLHRDAALLFSIPKSFSPSRYTKGIYEVYHIPLGDTREIRQLFSDSRKLPLLSFKDLP